MDTGTEEEEKTEMGKKRKNSGSRMPSSKTAINVFRTACVQRI